MSAQVLQQSSYTLSLSAAERDSLVDFLRQKLGEARVEAHRTHTPAFRDLVFAQEALIRVLLEKLERLGGDEACASALNSGAVDDESSAPNVVYVDEDGRFQMATDELESFIRFLRENKVRVDAERGDVFQSGGKPFAYARLLYAFDADYVNALYRTWKQSQGRGAALAHD